MARGKQVRILVHREYRHPVRGVVGEVDTSIGGARVYRILDRLFLTRALPEILMLEFGPPFGE